MLNRDGVDRSVREGVEAHHGGVADRDRGDDDEQMDPGPVGPVSTPLGVTSSGKETDHGWQQGQPRGTTGPSGVESGGSEPKKDTG